MLPSRGRILRPRRLYRDSVSRSYIPYVVSNLWLLVILDSGDNAVALLLWSDQLADLPARPADSSSNPNPRVSKQRTSHW